MDKRYHPMPVAEQVLVRRQAIEEVLAHPEWTLADAIRHLKQSMRLTRAERAKLAEIAKTLTERLTANGDPEPDWDALRRDDPVEWTIHTPAGRFAVKTLLDAQELDSRNSTGTIYWEGLSALLGRIARDYAPAQMYVTENGSCYDDEVDADGSVNDSKRRDYLVRHLDAVRRTREQGVPVKGYFAWSLLDNFEWAEGYLRRFGLTYIDYPTQRRILKQSGQWYSAFVRGKN